MQSINNLWNCSELPIYVRDEIIDNNRFLDVT